MKCVNRYIFKTTNYTIVCAHKHLIVFIVQLNAYDHPKDLMTFVTTNIMWKSNSSNIADRYPEPESSLL